MSKRKPKRDVRASVAVRLYVRDGDTYRRRTPEELEAAALKVIARRVKEAA